jgi:GNAT superfamily N-acetyltransferase
VTPVLASSLLHPAAVAQADAPRIHLASAADVAFIVEAIAAESRLGHFSCDCSRPDVMHGLWHQVGRAVADGVMPLPGERDGAGARAFVVQVGGANAGFAILVEERPGSWHQRLELFAMTVHPVFRGRGLGRHLVGRLVRDAGSALVYARCGFGSAAMAGMLKSCGFELGGRSDRSSVTLEWRGAALAG